MKTYSIGRDMNCDIVINDNTDVISRRHALLNVMPSGKMTIIDQSSNGTYVNGIRITNNVPVPVTRKDIVSLAHVAKLDWNQVPKPNQTLKYLIAALIAIVVILAIIFGIKAISDGGDGDGIASPGSLSSIELPDSNAIKQKEAARLDSIKDAQRQDSIAKKARQDSINDAKKTKSDNKKESEKTKKSTKPSDSNVNKDKNKEDKSGQNKKRTIG